MGRGRKVNITCKFNMLDCHGGSPANAASGGAARVDSGSRQSNTSGHQSMKLVPGMRPRLERSWVMVQAILEAAAGVFADMGCARAAASKIAERAGVSVGSLYQYFPDKDSLLSNLHALHHTR